SSTITENNTLSLHDALPISDIRKMKQLEDITEFKLSPELLERLYEFSIQKAYEAGSVLLNANAYIRSIPIVTRGALKVIRTDEDGKEILVYYIRSGERCTIPFVRRIRNETSKVKAEVEEAGVILFLRMYKVALFIRGYPQWLDYIFRLDHKRFEELLEIVNDVTFKKVDERLLSLLNKKRELTGSNILNIT